MLFDKNVGFYNFNQYVDESYLDLTSQTGEYNIEYPINFLSDTLGGMIQSELLVIGADSGVGKSEIVNKIAFHNAAKGKKVYLFSLEGDKYDLINRMRYKVFLELLAKNKKWGSRCSFRDFLIYKIPEDGKKVLNEVDTSLKDTLSSLKVYNRKEDLSLAFFEAQLELINEEADLVIIDHLHYFDFHKKEYEAINDIMKKLKKLQDKYRLPIILVSHLRKKDKTRIFPNQEDFHGSSNIVKQADTCIVVAHIDKNETDAGEQEVSNLYKTGIRVVKSRTGFSQKIVGVLEYDLETRNYSSQYDLMICGEHYMADLTVKPEWAKNAN